MCGPVLAFFSTVSLGLVVLRFGASTWLPKVLNMKRAQHLEEFPEVELKEWELGSLLLNSSHSSLILWSVRIIPRPVISQFGFV